ncbi:glycoside hydrolase family 1 protein [Pendulispora albinea]|uniref:Glycoside hydrolase family 1 protein n=1 Tax=Pendulispora albinea TaxID=2741071 RepID=A0ABZ2M017_9BACT
MMPRWGRSLPIFVFTSSLGLALLPAAAGCDKTNPDDFQPPVRDAQARDTGSDAGEVGPEEVTFPQGFLWGSATSAFQTEKGIAHADWSKWVTQDPPKIKRGEKPDVGGPDSLNHIDDDVRALKESGQNAYRFSIEWARIYPTRESFDKDLPDGNALAVYDGLLTKLRAAGITPLVTLVHFSLPDYLATAGQTGWEDPSAVALFTTYAERMAARFKDKVDDWVTINEPLVVAISGYIAGVHPPGAVGQTARAFKVAQIQARAHARAYDAIHRVDTVSAAGPDAGGVAARVSVAAHLRTFHAENPDNAEDVSAAKRIEYVWNRWFLDAIVKGDWDDDFDGKLDGPNDKRADPELVRRADYIGINYYSDTLVSTTGSPKIPGLDVALSEANLNTGRAKTDVRWDIYPEGLRTVLLAAKDYGLPLLITENGLADASDKNRPRFLAEHIYQAGWAMQQGVPLLGYFHWSLVDNFEWESGYCPKFGLFSYDPNTGARTARPSASAYRGIITAGKLRRETLASFPAYATPTFCE